MKKDIYDIKLTGKQLQDIFGVSHMTIYRWKKEGMPFEKDGGSIVYNLEDVESWLEKNGATTKTSFK